MSLELASGVFGSLHHCTRDTVDEACPPHWQGAASTGGGLKVSVWASVLSPPPFSAPVCDSIGAMVEQSN